MGVEIWTDLEGVFPVNVVVHREHGNMETGQEDAAQYPLFFLICMSRQNKKGIRLELEPIFVLNNVKQFVERHDENRTKTGMQTEKGQLLVAEL
jgi:hypothetical protein